MGSLSSAAAGPLLGQQRLDVSLRTSPLGPGAIKTENVEQYGRNDGYESLRGETFPWDVSVF